MKRKGVWWLLEVTHDLNKEHVSTSLEEEAEVLVSVFLPSERTYLATTPQLAPGIVEELLEHFMDPVNGSNAKGRKPIGMCCLHVDDLFITGTPRVSGEVQWIIDEKTKKKSHYRWTVPVCQ